MNTRSGRYTGFTLIETLVAVTIVALAISGPLFAADQSLVANEVAKEKFTASLLAQEGLEYMRFIRDDFYLAAYKAGGSNVSTVAWNNFVSDVSPCDTPNMCMVDPSNPGSPTNPPGSSSGSPLAQCSGGVCQPLYENTTYGTYTQSNSGSVSSTVYTRSISVKTISAHEDAITSEVTWSYHGTPYQVTLTDNLTAWQ